MIGCVRLPPLDPRPLLPGLADFSPQVEVVSCQSEICLFLDFANLANAQPAELLDQLNLTVLQLVQQPPGLGLAAGKFPAQIAAASLGRGRTLVITPGCEVDFLRPLPIDLLPLDDDLARQFHLLGLTTLGHLAGLPDSAVLNRFGRNGRWLQQLARGQDNRPVQPYYPPPTESMRQQFDDPLVNTLRFSYALQQMLQILTTRLQAKKRICQTIHAVLQLADHNTAAFTVSLRQPTREPDRLLTALQAHVNQTPLTAGVVEITLTMANLMLVQVEQTRLFGTSLDNEQIQRLRQQIPQLLTRFGAGRLFIVELTAPKAYLPEHRFRLLELDDR